MTFGENLVDSCYWFVKLVLFNCLMMLVFHKLLGQTFSEKEYFYVGCAMPACLACLNFVVNFIRRDA